MFWFLVTLALPLAIYVYIKRKQKYEEFWKHIMAIPGPKPYPVVGNIEIMPPEEMWIRDRELALQFYPIYKMVNGGTSFIFLTSPEDFELILSNTKHNQKNEVYDFLHEWLGTGLLTSSGSKWHKRRKILTPAFHFSILQEFTNMLIKETQILVDNLKAKCNEPYIDVIKPITEFTLNSIGETSLGISLREDPKCFEYKKAVYDFGENFVYRIARPWLFVPFIYNLSNFAKENRKVIKTLHDFSTNVIKEKNKAFARDPSYSERKKLALLDLMLKAKNSGFDVDDEGIREELDTFIFEGHDTTSISLCYTLMILANNKNVQDEVYDEIISVLGEKELPTYNNLGELKYLERCIKESLRMFPSVPMIGRVAGENIQTTSGYIIPKGSQISLGIYDLHHNATIWENPEKFDPDRFLPENVSKRHPFAYIPFSAGSRNCIGQKFAILELKIALCEILRNFKLEPYDRPEHLRFKCDLVLRPVGEIRVTFVPRY